MDAIRVSKVEKVSCTKNATTLLGTIHLTAHHLIFRYDDAKEKEMWVPYPLISLVTRLPQTLQGQCPLTFHSRTFETFSLAFTKEAEASDVFDSVKELTVATSVQQLYAFFYSPNPPLPTSEGWSIYSPRDEFGRMGLGTRSKAWRFTDINKDYSFSPTYPSRLVVPTRISDTTLQYASKYRSKCRIPVLSYLHWANYGSITRCSQPMVGITQNRSVQDEKLIEAIFQTHHSPESRASAGPVYGATTTNLIIDARPTINAMGNTAKGAGSENMDHYKDSKKAYLGIDSIHVMRESLAKVVDALREADVLLASINNDLPEQIPGLAVLDRQALRRSGWLRHLQAIMEGTVLITRNVHVNSSHVLIHCSDGWDRTSQLSALAQLCLDPFYRTIRGFEILVEKDWLSFGHKFMDRCGHLSSEKFFVSPTEVSSGNNDARDAAQAFLASVQNRFASQHHIKETSPVFHQFLECVRQIQRQFPDRFEFNERFLHQLYYHLYSCQFGTFLFNCERERRVGDGGPPAIERTVSVWDFFNSPAEMEQNLNPTYAPELDDPASRAPKADMGVLFPNPKDIRFWNELYGRTDEEMNGRVQPPQVLEPEATSFDDDQGVRSPPLIPLPPSPAHSPVALPGSSQVSLTSATPPPGPSVQVGASPSMPSATPRPTPSRVDSFRPISSASAFSLRGFPSSSPTPPPAAPPSSPATPKNSGIRPPDFFANTSVKSVWGKLSSNASAALSVVQEAYVGVAKDLRNTSQDSDPQTKTAELSSRDTLRAWGEDTARAPSPAGSGFVPASPNPWNTDSSGSSTTSTSSSSIFENPWGTLSRASGSLLASTPVVSSPSSTPTPTQQRADPIQQQSAFPVDPTVSLPKQHSLPTSVLESGLSEMTLKSVAAPTRSRVQASEPPKAPSPTTAADIDPLGVGLS
ncbi:protein-tyrosine phosphatase-like protein [Mycena capillaripes]|nr:protein-tyrosine phosphatase-like protein [Mycena capillaripes]